ncbi:glycoside-pentoside-hexuronide (GPH):cation symporter [Virgibacillus halophilus]|uniref:Glycoside-pentoside-hexuronide (GPH):cation symporter n=1 Tax=Tigheibacillus halophilus TaxID=361280 RepID=A0ABU5C2W1_9BACI|nr:glycoside-pentoside-hexuronide (GPH):cation symporter [Virgibacillus halophilus]
MSEMLNPSEEIAGGSEKLSIKEKLSYGVGDIASNFVWGIVTSYLLFFYTDIFGITAAAAGTLFLITRLWDAINDPIMGVIIDKTKSKHGKTRPYLLYLSVPLAIIGVLTFITPDFSATGKLIYAYVTYTLLGMVYTAINLPYGALMTRMTRDSGEKGELNSYRGMGRTIGAIIVSACTLPLANYLGNGNQQIGFPITMGIYSLIAVVLFMVTFKNCQERVAPSITPKQQSPVRKSALDMLKNKYWVIIAISTILWFLRMGMMNAALIYYVNYYLERPGTIPLYLTLLNLANFVGAILALFALKKWGSRNTSIIMYTLATIIFVFLFMLGGESTILFCNIVFHCKYFYRVWRSSQLNHARGFHRLSRVEIWRQSGRSAFLRVQLCFEIRCCHWLSVGSLCIRLGRL